jgi:hypothetical protein
MNAQLMTSEQIRVAGLEALAQQLGPVGMIRFLQQFELGRGDYSVERHAWLAAQDVKTIMESLEKYQTDQKD